MKLKLLALVLLAGGSVFAGPRVFVGVGVGPVRGYYAPPPAVVYSAPRPYYVAPRFVWHDRFYARPYGAYSVGPHYYGRHYPGYWRR